MKGKIFFLILTTLLSLQANAQSVSINTDHSAPNASAILDVKSNNKGLLIPRTSTASRNAIVNPAKGLMVYDTTIAAFYFHNGTSWNALSSGGATNYWTATGANISNNNTGYVGIGLNTPLAPLHIKNNSEAFRIEGSRPYLSFYDNTSNLKSFILNTGNDLYIGMPASNPTGTMQLALGTGPIITMLPSGNVGIGTDQPDEKLVVQTLNNTYGILHKGEDGNILGTRMGGTSAGIGTFSNTNMRIFAGGNSAMFINASDNFVGVGIDYPTNKLQVGSVGNTSFATNDFAIGNGTNAMAILQSNSSTLIGATTDIVLRPRNNYQGNVGINVDNPVNKLQIGSVGNTFFAGNDLAIGNGTAALGIFQTNTATLIGSTTDIILRPRNNGQGRVGINTNTPKAPLDVSGYIDIFSGYAYLNDGSYRDGIGNCTGCTSQASIYASNRVLASEFDAFSDARIKNITGISNAANDIELINALQVKDYTMKDKVKYGNKQFKKVIAQEVEKVYPQVVSKHVDYIPNVYQVTNSIKQTADGYLLTFSNGHNISNKAKKVQIITEGEVGMKTVNIISIPSDKEVTIDAKDLKTDKLFVYGEEVDDFRTVDYEGLTTLNISATQELSKLIKKQAAIIQKLEKRISALESKPISGLVGIR